jgi:hypothetical protein
MTQVAEQHGHRVPPKIRRIIAAKKFLGKHRYVDLVYIINTLLKFKKINPNIKK